ncbi:MAG: acyl-CoA thioesterase [Acidobacteria bacterium]|nr:acyl-CoA thioesterase [Acidobacteriota bacterium]
MDPKEILGYADYHTTVRYSETDAMKVAYYGSYPAWFEAGRGAYGRMAGLSYREFEELGFYAVVAECHCRYIKSAVYGDEIIVRTWISEATSRTMKFQYEVYRVDDMTLLATGYTSHVCVSKEGRISKLPPEWLKVKDKLKGQS